MKSIPHQFPENHKPSLSDVIPGLWTGLTIVAANSHHLGTLSELLDAINSFTFSTFESALCLLLILHIHRLVDVIAKSPKYRYPTSLRTASTTHAANSDHLGILSELLDVINSFTFSTCE